MSKPLDHFRYEAGVLSSAGVSLERIANEVGTPVYVYSAEGFLAPLRELQRGLKGLDSLVCFAMKSCSNIAVVKLLADAGAGVDIVSGGELYRAGAAGVPADRIVFSGVGKTEGEMATALEFDGEGIASFNVESIPELYVLNQVAVKMGLRAPVSLRLNPDVNAKTHPYIATGLKKNKFGLEKSEVQEIVKNLAQFPGIELRGLSIHIGSQLLSLKPLEDAFKKTRALVVELNRSLPKPLATIDLGGGLAITYQKEKAPPIAAFCRLVKKYFGKLGAKIILEPGRAISGNSGVLLTEVLFRKPRKTKDFLIIDAAMNDLIRPALYESYHEIVPVDLRGLATGARAKLSSFDVVGPVCETGDFLAQNRKLPNHLDRGDLLAVLSTGAYGFSMASNYNSRPRPPEVLIENGTYRVVRERETYTDLVRGEHA